MRAELVLMGRRVDMAPRMNRRTLVVSIYGGLAALMIGFWFVDRWQVTGIYLIVATYLVNRLFLGGYNFGGLIKPFSGKAPRRLDDPPPFLLLALRVYRPEPNEDREYSNDERELGQRDRAHYLAYQAVAASLPVIWLAANWSVHAPRLLKWLPISAAELVCGLALAVALVAVTLPQAILLWTEPDMESDPAM